jgi:hypothetical protein
VCWQLARLNDGIDVGCFGLYEGQNLRFLNAKVRGRLSSLIHRGSMVVGRGANCVWELLNNIIDAFHQLGTAFDQTIRPLAVRRINTPWHGEDFAPLVERMPGGMQRTAVGCGFDDQSAKR